MDWDAIYRPVPPNRRMPAPPRLLETCWRVQTPSGRIVTCGIYSDAAPGLEVRAGFSDEDLIRSQRVAEIGSAHELAEEWRGAAIAKGFAEVRVQ